MKWRKKPDTRNTKASVNTKMSFLWWWWCLGKQFGAFASCQIIRIKREYMTFKEFLITNYLAVVSRFKTLYCKIFIKIIKQMSYLDIKSWWPQSACVWSVEGNRSTWENPRRHENNKASKSCSLIRLSYFLFSHMRVFVPNKVAIRL